MPLKDNVNQLAETAKWKASQQMRLLNIRNNISQQENSIRSQKANLADTAVKLFFDNQLNDENLKPICLQIQAIYNEIDNLKAQESAIKNETPPENVSNYNPRNPTAYSSSYEQPGSINSLVCPQCGRELRGKFCPVHGVAGVEKNPTKSESQGDVKLTGMVCPACGKELAGQFCPNDGTKGVPKPLIETPPLEISENSNDAQVIMVCPVCKKPLTTRFCNQHGVEGVPQV